MVTDNGANMVKPFENDPHYTCSCHNLNLVVQDVLASGCKLSHDGNKDEEDVKYYSDSESNMSTDERRIKDISQLLEKCKRLVRYFKKSSMQSSLRKSLKQSVKTRWNSDILMIESILENYTALKDILSSKNESRFLFTDTELACMRDIILVLKKFRVLIKSNQGNSQRCTDVPRPASITLRTSGRRYSFRKGFEKQTPSVDSREMDTKIELMALSSPILRSAL